MSKNILTILLLSTLALSVLSQVQADIPGHDQQMGSDQIPTDPSQQMKLQQQELSMKRTACLVLSRYHSNTNKEVIEGIITSLAPQEQQKYINKMYATAIEYCMPKITIDEAQKFFVEDPNFSADQMFYIFDGFSYENVDFSKFTKNQENLVKFIKNFDQEMQVRREQKEAEQDVEGEEGFDMKFFGLSNSSIPSTAKYAYIALFAALVGGSIWYLMSKLDTGKENNKDKNKKRKSPPKAEAARSSSASASSTNANASPSKANTKGTKKQ